MRGSPERREGKIFNPARRARLRSPGRRRRLPPFKILRRLGLKRGETFIDIGCGTGFFSLPAARIVGPGGRVVALDISPEMLADLQAEAERRGIDNIRIGHVGERDGEIPPNASLYFLANTFHEVEDQPAYLLRIRRKMGAQSRLAIVDYHKRRTSHGPPVAHRVALSRMVRWLRECGFLLRDVFDVNEEEYAVVSQKRKEKT